MSNSDDRAAAAARKTQAEYLEGLQREAKSYKDSGRKNRLAEVQAEIKRVEATLEPAAGKGTTTRSAAGKSGKGKDVDTATKTAGAGEKTGDDGANGAGGEKTGD